jgi:hypothetical protein
VENKGKGGFGSKNVKRIGSHAILTDYLIGKGHYGKVYLGYEVNNSKQD